MCGIIGYIGSKEVVPVLIEGLRRLEYRGYDSAGVAVVHEGAIDLSTDERRTYLLEISGVNCTLDDGHLSNIGGSIRLRDGELTQASFHLDATSIPFRLPQTLDLVVSASKRVSVVTAISPRARSPWRPSPQQRMTAMISSVRGGSGGYRRPLLPGRRPAR